MSDPLPAQVLDGAGVPGAGALRLSHEAVIRVHGADAAAFLHGQLTNDVAGMPLSEARLSGYCSPKGRMLASFVGFKRSADEIWLVCRADVLDATLKRLRMFVLRAKARLDAGGDALAVVGLCGEPAAEWLRACTADAASMPAWSHRLLADTASLLRLPDAAGTPRWLWIGPAEAAPAGPLGALPALARAHWDWLEVQAGIAPVQSATVEAFVPQMLNYELVGGVSFQKGCYPGQEVVARSQYRGTLKRRTLLLHSPAEAMAAGDEVFWSEDAAQPSGVVALAAPSPRGGHDALVELKLAVVDAGSLHLRAADGAVLQLRALPYELPPAPREAARA